MKKDDFSLWLLSAAPLLVSIILHGAGTDDKAVFAAVFLLNLFFVSYDYFKNGKRDGQPLYVYFSGLVLIPLYLYFRTAKRKRGYRFFILWAVLYIFDLAILQLP